MASTKDTVGFGSPIRLGSISDTADRSAQEEAPVRHRRRPRACDVGRFAAVFGIAVLPSCSKKADECMIGSVEQGPGVETTKACRSSTTEAQPHGRTKLPNCRFGAKPISHVHAFESLSRKAMQLD